MFVAQPPVTKDGAVIIAKNSMRPIAEVQEVVHLPAADSQAGSKLRCTYIEVEQTEHTHSLVLSKPAWMWGGEMGANEKGVSVATTAVWTKLNSSQDLHKKLLAGDLVRLALERSSSSKEALDVITDLIGRYGQGGPCSEASELANWAHHNSFIAADGEGVWLLETAGQLWAAKKITEPVSYIGNQLSITTDMEATSHGLAQQMAELHLGDGTGEVNFSESLSLPSTRSDKSEHPQHLQHLHDHVANGEMISAKEMFDVLRKATNSGYVDSAFAATGSGVSVLQPPSSVVPSSHWFTATSNPRFSMFKPIVFTAGMKIGDATKSPRKPADSNEDSGNAQHPLYTAQEKFRKALEESGDHENTTLRNIRELERNCFQDICEITENFNERNAMGVSEIFKHMCALEMNFYKF